MVGQAIEAAETAKRTAVRDILAQHGNGDAVARGTALRAILEGASRDDVAAIRGLLLDADGKAAWAPQLDPDEDLSADWCSGGYPYRNLMLRKN